jgi:hypothetical protein
MYLMGEAGKWLFEPTFNRAVKVRGKDDRLTSDAGLLLTREADHRLGLTESLAAQCHDPRCRDHIRYTLLELLRERLYALAQGYKAQDDLDRLAHDPALKLAVWDRPGVQVLDERLASQPTQSRLVDILARHKPNRAALRGALADWIERHLRAAPCDQAARYGTIDLDSFPIEVHGHQPGGAYNGHYREIVYHPLLASFSVQGDYEGTRNGGRLGNGFVHALLRKGSVFTAEGVLRFVDRAIRKCRGLGYVLDVRMDAGFAFGRVMDALTDRGVRFIGRLKGNPVLDRLAEPHLTRPVGRPPKEGYEYTVELGMHQAESWRHPQRLILVVVDQPDSKTGQLNLLPDYFFLVTNRPVEEQTGDESLAHYRGRGTFEDRLGEFNAAIGPRLSSPDFAENEVTLLLALLAFNLASMLRSELEDDLGGCWDLVRFQRSVLQAGGRVLKHARRLVVDLAQAVVSLWERLLGRLARWKLRARWPAPRGPSPRTWMPPPRHAFLKEVLRV